MKKNRLTMVFIFIGMLITIGIGQTPGDNTAFGIVWSDSDTTAFENHWQGDLTGPFDFDGDGKNEFISLLCDASLATTLGDVDPEKNAVLSLVEATGTGDYVTVWSYRWAPITNFSYGNGQRSVAVGDLDGDGNQEIVVGLEAGVGLPDIWIFEASMAGVFPAYPTATIFADQIGLAGTTYDTGRWSFEPFSLISDLDGDGNEEYVSTAASGLAIIELAGGTFTADPIWNVEYLNTTNFIKTWSITKTDLDQDGTPELCMASVGGNANWSRPNFLILESTGTDAYAILVNLNGDNLPTAFSGANGTFVEADFDAATDSHSELYITDTQGQLWLFDIGVYGSIAAADSNYFYLLNTFNWQVGDWQGTEMVAGNLDGNDGGDLYIAGGFRGNVWDVEYVGGSVNSGISYMYYTMVDTNDALVSLGNFRPMRLAIVGDNALAVQSVNTTGNPTMYVVEWGPSAVISVQGESSLPTDYRLKSNYPNPFNPATMIQYDLKETGNVSINIFNIKGQLIRTLVNEMKESGSHQRIWDGKTNSGISATTGIYLAVMQVNDFRTSIKVTLMK
jgi:hypothetical protein